MDNQNYTLKKEKAFPAYEYQKAYDQMMAVGGMDLRDYFAAKAMQAYVQLKEVSLAISEGRTSSRKICEAAYDWADAMLKAREQ